MRKIKLSKLLFIFCVFLMVVYTLFPVYWSFISSTQTTPQIQMLPSLNFKNYQTVLQDAVFRNNLLSSLFVASLTVFITLIIAIPAAFALARFSFKGRSFLLFAILSISMFPQIVLLSGMFQTVNFFNLYNSRFALVFSYLPLVLPFTVWVLTSFIQELPKEMEEASIVDGCNRWQSLWYIFLPILGPAIATTGILAFIIAWHEFLFALTFILDNDKRTVPVAIALFSGASKYELPYHVIMAASLIVTLPLMIMVFLFQRKIISGLTAGTVKG
ncbi:MAG: carbohydrate ABC transporter permease [Alphaproteobacteria bacterium]